MRTWRGPQFRSVDLGLGTYREAEAEAFDRYHYAMAEE
jgi:hypothetical protein